MSEQRTAIVTGSSRGIGAAIAKRLATDRFAVIVNYAGRASDAERVVSEIQSSGGKAISIKADVSDPNAVHQMFDAAETEFGGVDLLVNNAGIMPAQLPPLAATSDETFDQVFAINVKGTFNALREAATRLRSGGRIINFSSSVVGLLGPGYSVYAASKAAVETLTAIFAKELRGRQITVNAIAPGPTATELFLTGKSDELVQRLAKTAPLERLGTPEDIASVVAFLAGPDGAWVNGQTIRVNGGLI